MNERTHIPSTPACGRWETLLADALDGLLLPEDEATFTDHMAGCPACAALFEEAQRGREWLGFLTAEPEVPEGLMDRILSSTGPGHKLAQPVMAGAGAMAVPAWHRPGFMGQVRRWAEPRLMMTSAMAFFSIALTLNLVGVRMSDIRLSDLRPTAIRSYMERRITMASVPFVRYYDHLRFVYEVQSRVRELRNQSDEAQPQQNAPAARPGESQQKQMDQQQKEQKGPGGSRVEPQQSVQPVLDPNLIDTSLRSNPNGRAFPRVQKRASGRSRVWTA
jgi:Putative zinc-finger